MPLPALHHHGTGSFRPPPSGPYLTVTSAHGAVTVGGQDGRTANVRLKRPVYPFTHILAVQVHNTPAFPSNQPYWGSDPFGYLATQGAGNLSVDRELLSPDDGAYTTQIYQEMSNGTVIMLTVNLSISPSEDGKAPDPSPVPTVPTLFREEFAPRTQTGALYISFGNCYNTEAGTVRIDGVGSCNQPFTGASKGFGNGLFQYRSRYIGPDIGDGSGPCQLLWPSDDLWPGTEIDLGELFADGTLYLAVHWAKNGIAGSGGTANNGDQIWAVRDNPLIAPTGVFDHQATHTYGARLANDRIIFTIDGLLLADYRDHPAPDFANGGVNHSFGILCNSTNRGLEVEWCQWTPEADLPPLA